MGVHVSPRPTRDRSHAVDEENPSPADCCLKRVVVGADPYGYIVVIPCFARNVAQTVSDVELAYVGPIAILSAVQYASPS